jgi:hypothetical protein
MVVSDVIEIARLYSNDPSNQGRWSDNSLTIFTNRAQQIICRELQFPMARASFTTTPGQQEYDGMPAFVSIMSLYVNGQLSIATDIPTLEGHQDELYDQGFGTGPGSQAAGSGGPPGTTGQYTPAWNIQAPSVYPVPNSWGLPAPRAQAWFNGQRPRYYFRSGRLGLVPAPSGQAVVCIDGVIPPPKLTVVGDYLLYDDSWLDLFAWKVVEQMCYSDDSDRATAKLLQAQQMYGQQVKEIRGILKGFTGDDPHYPKLLTARTFYQKGNNRNPGPWTEYP